MQFELLPPVPAIHLVRRLKEIPLFRFASMDELFRISAISRQARYAEKAVVQKEGAPPEYIQVLLEGKFRVQDRSFVSPPAMLGFREVLQGTPLSEDARAETESIALVMPAEEFRVLLAANIELAQGLFRMLLDQFPANGGGVSESEVGALAHVQDAGTNEPGSTPGPAAPLTSVDKLMLLQTVPIFSHATAGEIYALAAVAREVSFEPDAILVTPGAPASILLLLSGRLELRGDDGSASVAGPGRCLGVNETLAGSSWTRTGRALGPGKALVIDHRPLFDLLSDRMDLLQGIFSAVFQRGERREASR